MAQQSARVGVFFKGRLRTGSGFFRFVFPIGKRSVLIGKVVRLNMQLVRDKYPVYSSEKKLCPKLCPNFMK
jgi:hypothetical protein